METRRTSGLVVLGFLASLLVYGTFIASVVMTTIVTSVDRDRGMCAVTGLSPRDAKDLLFALQITSMVGAGLAVLSTLLTLGGVLAVFGDRLKKKGLSLAFVALGLSAIAGATHAYVLGRHSTTRLGQAGAPFEMRLESEDAGKGFVLSMSATGESLDAAREYEFHMVQGNSWEVPKEVADVTDRVLAAIGHGKPSAEVRLDGVKPTREGYCSVSVYARPRGTRPLLASEVDSNCWSGFFDKR